MEPQPQLAERWQVSPDGKAYTLFLRRGVKWYDGKPFTAADVKFTFEQVLLKYHSRTKAGLENMLAGIETPDETTAVFRFKEPYAPLLRRLAQSVVVLLAAVALAFTLIHLAPGDPISALAGESGDATYYAEMRAHFGLDRPLPEQFLAYAGNVLRGDFGRSYVRTQPVFQVLLGRLPATALLPFSALALSTVVGVGLGAEAGRRAGSPVDAAIRAGTLLVYCAPAFWLGQLFSLLFALWLGWLPVQGMVSARGGYQGLAYAVDVAKHLVLPAVTLGLLQLALIARLTRAGVREALAEDFARTASATGLAARRLAYGHALPNALLPVVTVVGSHAGTLITGAVLVEIVFAWPGLGRLLYDATLSRDYPLLMAIFELATLTVVVTNLGTDLLYAALDPRVRHR